MTYIHHRYYDSSTGRFVTEDPAKDGLNWYVYCNNNPLRYVDPDGLAAILQRVINRGSNPKYNLANSVGSATKISYVLHGLVDRGELGGVNMNNSVSQYSGSQSGFTTDDIGSQTSEYIIRYSGMDDKLTDQAVTNVLNSDRFGGGDNEKAKSLYRIFINDCNTYTAAVFNEYKNLWLADYKQKFEGSRDRDANKAWKEHYKDITKDSGKVVDFSEEK